MPTTAEVFAEAEAKGALDTLPEDVFPRMHKPNKDVSLQMDFLHATAAGEDAARAKAAIRLVAMLARTRIHDSVARPIVEAAATSRDAEVKAEGLLAVAEVDSALAEKEAVR